MNISWTANIDFIIIIIIKKEEIKVTLKTIKPLQGHFTK